ncbi:MarR family winged helix-turn-helix transcriptional regulator [Serpentinicella alkaliphila]|uniref:MarR family transcriptional regulator n=1 Tax=Serpentinicella alkaliphila TaxID=1734049 RepID=A0A4R2TNN1_9FIRM|nr:MarR family transcriptional regulator [Serpentinicella alkaliphila]QUH25741.1 MarR family transcriptional regulator [Serpentinicella alkaliphila]TCP99008.1 MarR family transcriptional regulator [Serpentinicella alkaliphila]
MHFNEPDSLNSMFYQVIRYHYQRTHMLLDKIGLYPGQPFLLFALYKSDGQSQKDLANKLNIKASTITAMVKRMEKSGLIERRQDSIDQRISRVYITDKGKEVCMEVDKIKKEIEFETFRNFTEEDKIKLKELFTQMKRNLITACENP